MDVRIASAWGAAIVITTYGAFFLRHDLNPDFGPLERYGYLAHVAPNLLLKVDWEEAERLFQEIEEVSSDRYADWPAVEAAFDKLRLQQTRAA